jgi:tartrate dehydrogenase/decarboxylase/D-malate dehydrogenase
VAQLRAFDAIPFGAVGAPDVPDHLSLWQHRLAIRQLLVQFSNVRPTRILVGIDSGDLNWVVVR